MEPTTMAAIGNLAQKELQSKKQQMLGAMQMFYGGIAARRARMMKPTRIDSEEQKYKAELDAIRKGNYTGAAIADALRQLRVTQLNNQQAILSAAGGNTGAAIAGVGYSNASLANEIGKLQIAGAQTRQQDTVNYGNAVVRSADRRADLDMMDYTNAVQGARQLMSDGMNNIMTGGESDTSQIDFDALSSALGALKTTKI